MKQVVLDRLEQCGIRPSLQRIAILEYLMDNPIHPTVDKVYLDLAPSIPTLSKTTVYSTLKLLAEVGVITAITIDERNIRYDADITEHAHFVCKSCDMIYDLKIENFDQIKILNQGKLKITEGLIYFKGYCEKCLS